LAIDNDPAALDNARDNIEMNAASNIDLQLQEASALSGSFNLILANIYAELLLDLMPVLQRVSKPKTWLICAGILDYLAPQVISAYEVAGWELIESAHQGEWVALLWKRTPQ
jgi:ribosomal protein L11 methyltransferase